MRNTLVVYFLLFGYYSLIFSQNQPFFNDTTFSEIHLTKDQNGDVIRTNVHRDFEYIELSHDNSFLIHKEILIKKNLHAEGQKSKVKLTAYDGNNFENVLWYISDEGAKVKFSYRGVITEQIGCCSIINGYRRYNILTGKFIESYSGKALRLSAYRIATERYVTFLDNDCIIIPRYISFSQTVLGVLNYSTPDSLIDKYIIHSPQKEDAALTYDIYWVNWKNESIGDYESIKCRADSKAADVFTGKYISIDAFKEEPIIISIMEDKINLGYSKLPYGVILENYFDVQYLFEDRYTYLESKSDDELRLLRNEIFARHGHSFNSSDLQKYFKSKDWYNEKEYHIVPEMDLLISERIFLNKIMELEKKTNQK